MGWYNKLGEFGTTGVGKYGLSESLNAIFREAQRTRNIIFHRKQSRTANQLSTVYAGAKVS